MQLVRDISCFLDFDAKVLLVSFFDLIKLVLVLLLLVLFHFLDFFAGFMKEVGFLDLGLLTDLLELNTVSVYL